MERISRSKLEKLGFEFTMLDISLSSSENVYSSEFDVYLEEEISDDCCNYSVYYIIPQTGAMILIPVQDFKHLKELISEKMLDNVWDAFKLPVFKNK